MGENTPNPALRRLDVLVGTWNVVTEDNGQSAGDGQITFEWMDGGFFLCQRIDLGRLIGIEYIGYDERSGTLRSQVYSNVSPAVLHYTWQVEDRAVTIWFGEPGSDNRFEGRLSDDGSVISGAWRWPGGGYAATMTRVRETGRSGGGQSSS
jgi:hypothetical protein